MTLSEFNELLVNTKEEDLLKFTQKHILHGTPHVFRGDEEQFFEFRSRIANNFGVSYTDVFIVGSAKMGFSYHKDRDSFTYDSDVDIAIVSAELFAKATEVLSKIQYRLSVAEIQVLQPEEDKEYRRFLRWYLRGWIRPETIQAPAFAEFSSLGWIEYFNSISNGKSEVGNYAIEAGIFRSYHELEVYQHHGIKKHYNILRTKEPS